MKIKRYIPSSTRRWLANRAIETAAFLEQFANRLTETAQLESAPGAKAELGHYPMSTSFAQKIEFAYRYVADAVVIIAFCGLSALLGIIAAIGYSAKTPSSTLLFVAGGVGILIVLMLTMIMTWLETKKFERANLIN
jgi:hypothetical protein